MRITNPLILTVMISAVLSFACGGDPSTNNSNTNAVNTNAPKTNSNTPVAVTTPAPAQTTNNATTLTPVFKAYCLAMEKKDEAAIRKVYSKDTIQSFEADMKAEGSKSLIEYLLSTDNVSSAKCEVRNEEITGNTAVAEVKTAGMPNGAKIVFVKEGAEWKLTNRSPDLDAVKQTAQPAANTGK